MRLQDLKVKPQLHVSAPQRPAHACCHLASLRMSRQQWPRPPTALATGLMPPGQTLLPRVSSWGQWRGLIDTRRHRTPVSGLMKEVHAAARAGVGPSTWAAERRDACSIFMPLNSIHVEFSRFTRPNKNFSSVRRSRVVLQGRLQCTGSPPGPGATPGLLVSWWARLRPESCNLSHQGCTPSPVAIGAQVHVLCPQASHPRGGG